MMKHIKPAREGLLVRKSNGTHLKPDGENLLMSTWWCRRETEGDVIITDVAEESAKDSAASQSRNVKEK
ncbi:DUF2635 domain-containing protein [Citrobacter freundii]|uniref:DUF2635 domain-containing protein n=1 Tax=Citrobacter freundii TaxID=546 RepID=UPI002DB7289D|nr:DUF2635 domain-containing protein [Citrobacter freundii]MEB6425749.1 DUF2635 domain-containing protein [Citrobacter freundii]